MKTLNIITATIIAFTLTACGPSAEEVAAAEQQNLVESYIKDQTNDFMELVATPDPIDTAPEFFLRKPGTPWNKDMEDTPANLQALCSEAREESPAREEDLRAILLREYGERVNGVLARAVDDLVWSCNGVRYHYNNYVKAYAAAEELAYDGKSLDYSVVEEVVRDGMNSSFYEYFASRPTLEGMDYSQLPIVGAYRKYLGLEFDVYQLNDGSEQVRYQVGVPYMGRVDRGQRQMRFVSNGKTMYSSKYGADNERMNEHGMKFMTMINWDGIPDDGSNMSKLAKAVLRKKGYNKHMAEMRLSANPNDLKLPYVIRELK